MLLSKPASAIVGVAHHVSFMRPYGLFDVAAVSVANSMTLFPFLDCISDKMDYIGINYYGQVLECLEKVQIEKLLFCISVACCFNIKDHTSLT